MLCSMNYIYLYEQIYFNDPQCFSVILPLFSRGCQTGGPERVGGPGYIDSIWRIRVSNNHYIIQMIIYNIFPYHRNNCF